MKTIPPYLGKTISNAERKMFSFISECGDLNGWYCLHSLGLSTHISKREGEIDFLLIGPEGVFVIEVKGGRVRRESGVWKFTDRYGRVTEKRESPFNQARSAMYSLRADLAQKFGPDINKYLFGYGVALPDIEFNTESPEWDLETVYDARDLDTPFSKYLERLTGSWRRKQRYAGHMTGKDIKDIVTYLRGDFETVRPLSLVISETEQEIIKLTEEQLSCLDAMSDNPRVMFVGAAGTGKTLLAVEQARRNEVSGLRTLFLCFNKFLSTYIKDSLSVESDIRNTEIKTIHGFFHETIVNGGLESELQEAIRLNDDETLYREVYPKLFEQAWDGSRQYDALIIDEAQDVMGEKYIGALGSAIKGGFDKGNWFIFLDPENQKDMYLKLNQELFDSLKSNSVNYRLNVNCRNTKPIAIQTEVITNIETASVRKIEGPRVQYIWYENEAEESVLVSEAVNTLFDKNIEGEEVVILSPKRTKQSVAGSGRLRLHKPLYELDYESIQHRRSGQVAYSTIQSYKGLESPVVVLTDIDKLEDDWSRVVNYVGFTRATTSLIVAMQSNLKKEYMTKLKELGQSK